MVVAAAAPTRSIAARRLLAVPSITRTSSNTIWALALLLAAQGALRAQSPAGKEATVPKPEKPAVHFNIDNVGGRMLRFTDGDPAQVDAPTVTALSGGAAISLGDFYITARNILIWTDGASGTLPKYFGEPDKGDFPYGSRPPSVNDGMPPAAFESLEGAAGLPLVSGTDEMGSVREIYAEGEVYIKQSSKGGNNVFQAERAYFNLIEDRSLIIQGELRSDLNSIGSISGSDTSASKDQKRDTPAPIVVRAAEIRGISKGLFEADNATFTTCTFAVPGYHVAMDHMVYEQRVTELSGRVTGYGNRLVIADRPIIALPYLTVQTGTDSPLPLVGLSTGSSEKFGFFIKTKWGGVFQDAGDQFNQWLGVEGKFEGKWFGDVNLYTDRGLGIGAGIKYETKVKGKRDPLYFGETRFFWINDSATSDATASGHLNQTDNTDRKGRHGNDGDPRNRDQDYSGNRGQFKTQNRVRLPSEWQVDTEINYVSDRNFLREFFESDAFKEKEPETLLYLKKLDGDSAVTALARYRLNDWQTQTQYLPQATYDVISRPIATFDDFPNANGENEPLRMYWTHRTEAAYVDRLYADDLVRLEEKKNEGKGQGKEGHKHKKGKKKNKEHLSESEREDRLRNQAEGSAVRLDDIERINLPFDIGPVGIDPYFETRVTSWSGDAEVDGGGGAARLASTVGFNASTQFWRTETDYESEFWNIHGLRNIVLPGLRYRYTFLSTEDSEDLIPYDSVENFDTLHVLVPGIRSRYQTKRMTKYGRATVTFLDIDVQQPLVFENGRDDKADTLGDFHFDARYRPDLEYYLLQDSSFRTTVDWNWNESEVDQFKMEFETEPGPDFFTRLAYSYARRGRLNPTLALDGITVEDERDKPLNSFTVEFAYQATRLWEFVVVKQFDFESSNGGKTQLLLRRRTHDWMFEFGVGATGGFGGFGVSVAPLAFFSRSEHNRFKSALSDGYDLTPIIDESDYVTGPALEDSSTEEKP